MTLEAIMSCVDHTLLSPGATLKEMCEVCDDAIKYKTASICIPPSYVKAMSEYSQGRIPVCTVIGFPNGYNTTYVKCCETEQALKDGAKEIDMVINIGKLKDKKYLDILSEIKSIKNICGKNILKVIIETCLLSEEEKIRMCEIVTESGADFIKTSTGFSSGGATFDDISLFSRHVGSNLKIKAAGGIKSFDDAEKFISLGAHRLGTSRLVAILKNSENNANSIVY